MSSVLEHMGSGPTSAETFRHWISALDGQRPAPARLLDELQSNPGRIIGTATLPGTIEPASSRVAASVLTASFSDVRIASGCGPAGSWLLKASDEPSTILLAPLNGRFRVTVGEEIAVIEPSAACFVTDDFDLVVEGLDDPAQLLSIIVPAVRIRTLHRELTGRGAVHAASSPDQRAALSYLGTLLVASLVDETAPSQTTSDTIVALITALAEGTLAQLGRSSRSTELRRAALRCIDQHHRMSSFGVDDVARELFISRRQLYRAFPDAGGIAGMIAQRRLQTAERLMRDQPGLQLGEVAASSGFSTAGVMRAHFRRVYGTTPQQHRDAAAPQRAEAAVRAHPWVVSVPIE